MDDNFVVLEEINFRTCDIITNCIVLLRHGIIKNN